MRKQIYILIIFIIGFSNAISDTIIAPPFDNFAMGIKVGIFRPILQTNYNFVDLRNTRFDNFNPKFKLNEGIEFGTISMFKLNNKLSISFGIQYSSLNIEVENFYHDPNDITINGKYYGDDRYEKFTLNDYLIELPIQIRQNLVSNIFNTDIITFKNSLGFFFGSTFGMRLIRDIEYKSYLPYHSINQTELKNKLNKYTFRINFGIDLLQPEYQILLNFNYSILNTLDEQNNPILNHKERANINFHSFNMSFVYFLVSIDKGKYN